MTNLALHLYYRHISAAVTVRKSELPLVTFSCRTRSVSRWTSSSLSTSSSCLEITEQFTIASVAALCCVHSLQLDNTKHCPSAHIDDCIKWNSVCRFAGLSCCWCCSLLILPLLIVTTQLFICHLPPIRRHHHTTNSNTVSRGISADLLHGTGEEHGSRLGCLWKHNTVYSKLLDVSNLQYHRLVADAFSALDY